MKVVRAQGTPYERGAAIGAAFADAMTSSLAFNRRYLAGHGMGHDALERLLEPYLAAASASLPHLVSQLRGMADGAGRPFLDVFAANAFEEVYGVLEPSTPSPVPLERCTDIVLCSGQNTLLGHSEQWYAGDDGAVGLVLDVSDDGPSVLAPVVAGTLPLVGLNELGGAFGTMSLTATDERIGIPRALVARDLLEASDFRDAFTRASREDRAGGYAYLCTFPGGEKCTIETTATTAATLSVTVHTNHALDPAVATTSCEPSAGSRSRLARARALAAVAQPTVDGIADVLADHAAEGQDICVHPDPALGDEASTILFSMICESDTRSMWLASGHPCSASFERFGFDDTERHSSTLGGGQT